MVQELVYLSDPGMSFHTKSRIFDPLHMIFIRSNIVREAEIDFDIKLVQTNERRSRRIRHRLFCAQTLFRLYPTELVQLFYSRNGSRTDAKEQV